ncbi:MAG TPA: sigma-70 family RNA polymerase sigma factor [Trebonia sp.]|nr:sigma-70 family RNA polymerase sigma factor [Trebonia sp.]
MAEDSHLGLADGLWKRKPEAVAQVLEQMGQPLYDYLSLMLGDRDVATHALADTIIVAIGHVGSLSDPESLPAWLFALARREYQRRTRAATSRAMPDTLGTLKRLPSGNRAPDKTATSAELVYLALLQLDPLEREVFVLAEFRWLLGSHDIARILGMRRGDAVDIHRRALDRLHERIAASGIGDGVTPGELLGWVSRHLLGDVSRERVVYMCLASDLAERRRRVQEEAGPLGRDGFPLLPAPEDNGNLEAESRLGRMLRRLTFRSPTSGHS